MKRWTIGYLLIAYGAASLVAGAIALVSWIGSWQVAYWFLNPIAMLVQSLSLISPTEGANVLTLLFTAYPLLFLAFGAILRKGRNSDFRISVTHRKIVAAAALTLIAIAVGGAIFSTQLPQQTVLNVGPIYVDPQGSEASGEWQGSFWNVLVSVQGIDDIAGYKQILPEGQDGSVTIGGQTYNLETDASIEIRIDPEQPYLIRNLVEKNAQVTPQVGRTWMSVVLGRGEAIDEASADAFNLRYYDWAESGWRIYTPFTVTIYKDGVQVGQATLNTVGVGNVQTISTSEGSVRIENLGILGGNYLSPSTPSQVAIIKGYPNMYDWTQIYDIVTYDSGLTYGTRVGYNVGSDLKTIMEDAWRAYSCYWYGDWWRWSDNNHPAGFSPGVGGPTIISQTAYGGWVSASDSLTYRRDPVKPVFGISDKSSLPSDKRSFMSLEEYITSKIGPDGNIAGMFQGTFESASFVYEGGQVSAMKLTIPWGAYGTPLVNIRVPTELADTLVDRPSMIHAEPTAHWESTGTKNVDIISFQKLYVDVKSFETSVSGSTDVMISCGNGKVGLYPLEQTVSLAPGETKTISFTVSNLGVETENSNVPITVKCYETYAGAETGSDIVYATLLPTLIEDQTYVTVLAYDKTDGTSVPITGLQIQVLYPPSGPGQIQGFTDTNGQVSFTLIAGSGGYVGEIAVQSAATMKYNATYQTTTVHTGYNPPIIIEFGGSGSDESDWWQWLMDYWWAIALVIVIIVAVIVNVWYVKRKRP